MPSVGHETLMASEASLPLRRDPQALFRKITLKTWEAKGRSTPDRATVVTICRVSISMVRLFMKGLHSCADSRA